MAVNFPLFNNHLKLTSEELLDYVLTFSNHRVFFSKKTEQNPDYLLSYHQYEDNLLIKFKWKPLDKSFIHFSKPEKNSDCIRDLLQEKVISLIEGKIFYYSESNPHVDDQVFDTFHSIISKKEKTISQKEYELLEYPPYKTSLISDDEFQYQISKNHNIILFKQFLKERDALN